MGLPDLIYGVRKVFFGADLPLRGRLIFDGPGVSVADDSTPGTEGTRITISGRALDTEVSLTTTTPQTALALGGASHIHVNAGGTATIQGIVAPVGNDPSLVTIYATALMVLETNSASAPVPANRILTGTATDPSAKGFVLRYSPARARWCLVGYPA